MTNVTMNFFASNANSRNHLTVCKQMSPRAFKNHVTYNLFILKLNENMIRL